jgi:predicted AAA+ superfamily ATPase
MDQKMISRRARQRVLEALSDTRVVVIVGARQVGKSTLAFDLTETAFPATIVNLDDRATREAIVNDPVGGLADIDGPVFIDEVQRGGNDLLLEIKASVDRDPRPGRFLLTGSANLLATRRIFEALTGRTEIIRLSPLAQCEIEDAPVSFVDALFAGEPPRIVDSPRGRRAFVDRVIRGGFPEVLDRSGRRRDAWFSSYLDATLSRDLRELSDAHKLRELPGVLRLAASQAANLFVVSSMANRLGLDPRTVAAYCDLLEAVFLIRRIPGWRPGIGAREVQTPKLHVVDSGLLCHLLGADMDRLASDDQVTGRALESFVAMEVARHADWAETDARLYHYRSGRREIDLVLESRGGDIACIEVKAAASFEPGDWRSMAALRDERRNSFRCGVLLYTGERTLPLGERLWAVPISGLWETG